MDFLHQILDFVLHIKPHLDDLITRYDAWVYLILCAILFAETGLVVTPFLPGDSLLFTVGVFAAQGRLSLPLLLVLLPLAVVLGDTTNYWVGKKLGAALLARFPRLVKRKHLERTQAFYEVYGRKTIVLARFVPIVRTFAPFVAGIGTMEYRTFITFSVLGGCLWVALCSVAGYLFGNIPWVEKNFEAVIVMIIVISVLPIAFEWWKHRRAAAQQRG